MADPLEQAAQRLEAGAKALVDLPALMQAGLAQRQAQAEIARAQAQPGLLQVRAELESRGQAQQGQLDLAQAQGRVAFGQTAAGQAASQAQAATGQQQTLADLQQARQRAEAEAAQLRTPQGQAQARQMRIEQARLEEAQRQAQALQQGPASTMDTLGAAARGVTSVFGALKTVTTQIIGTLMEVGGKASPTHAATLQGSFDLLAAKLGTAVLPAMEEVSRALQSLARVVPTDKLRQYGESYADFLRKPGLTGWGTFVSTPLRIAETKPEFSLDYLKTIAGFGPKEALLQSYKALPQAGMGTFEQQTDRMQLAGLQQGPLETELLTQQLEALKDMVGLLRDGVGPEAPVNVNFR